MTIRHVGPGSTYFSIADAMMGSGAGDTIILDNGYSNEAATVLWNGMTISGAANSIGITLQLAGGIPIFATAGLAPFTILDAPDGNGIVANDGNNTVTVSGGVDAVDGGLGIDRLIVDYHLATGAVTGDSTSNFTEAGGGGRSVTITDGTFEHFTVLTGAGADTLTTGAGDDVINAGQGANTITAGDGNNGVTGGNDADTITTGGGNDTILAGDGFNVVSAGQGANRIIGGAGADSFTALDGGNFFDGGDGTNTLTSGAGNDTIISGTGAATIMAGAGDDEILLRGGAASVDAGPGNDLLTLDYAALSTDVTGGVTAGNPGAGYTGHIGDGAGVSVDFLTTERFVITTGNGNDRITTGDAADNILGGAGNDTLDGGGGSDTLFGGLGDDSLIGGAGIDTAEFAPTLDPSRIGARDAVVLVKGADGLDSLTDIEFLKTGASSVSIATLSGLGLVEDLAILASGGTAHYILPDIYSGPVAGLQYQLLGSETGEVALGTSGNDFINALGGDDAIDGGAGNDVIDGGSGSNFLTGGAGRDDFFLDGRGGAPTWSTITDFGAGETVALWGWDPGVSKMTWAESAGAPGYQGVTMFADIAGDGLVYTVVTWTGLAQADLPVPHEYSGLLWFV